MRLGGSASQAKVSHKVRQVLLALVCFLFPLLLTPAIAHQESILVWTHEPFFEGWGEVKSLDAAKGWEGAIYYAVLGTHGIYRSSGPERAWISVSDVLPTGSLGQVQVRAFSVDPSNPLVIYAALRSVTPGRPRLYRSESGGESWMVLAGLTDRRIHVLGVPSDHSSWVYAATENQFYRSTDGGATWEARGGWRGSTEILCMAISFDDPDRIYLGTSGRGLLITVDGGVSWIRSLPDAQVFALAAGRQGSIVYAGTDSGLYGTDDGGATWQVRGEEWTGHRIYAVAVSPTDDRTLYVGIEYEGVYRSYDGGQDWIPLKRGLGNATVRALAVDPSYPWLLFAGTNSGLWYCQLFSLE